MTTPASEALISRLKDYLVLGQRELLPMEPKAVHVNELNSHILGPGCLRVSLIFSMNLALGRNSGELHLQGDGLLLAKGPPSLTPFIAFICVESGPSTLGSVSKPSKAHT